jgi:TonB-linked SusC/RagA family outer membrane protein
MTKIVKRLAISLVVVLMICPLNKIYAQGRQITGKVTSAENKQPLPGVTVTVKGAKKAVVTDLQGNFKITVDNDANALIFTSTGFILYEASISGQSSVNVEMAPDVKAQEEVVVIGYQTVKRKDLLASVSSISAKDLKDIPITSAAEALNGRLAGVTATTSEGSPDAEVRVRVRGGMSITGDNSPLYIIDGVQVENGLNVISPQDIESINVLKDAAATAIYGARGANGVFVITTKSGKPGRTIVSYDGSIGIKRLAKTLDVLDPYDYVFYQSERSRGSGSTTPNDSTRFADNFGHTWDTLENYKNIDPVNWQKKTFGRTGITTRHILSVSGGNKKITFNFGYTYNNDKAIVINSNYKRHLLNFKGEYNIIKNLKAGISTRYTHQDVYGAGVSDAKGSQYNRLRNAVKYRPFLSNGFDIDDNDPVADPNVGNGLNLYNPITLANSEYRKKATDAYNFTAFAAYTILKNLSFKSTFGYDYNNLIDRQFSDSITPFALIQGGKKPVAGFDRTTKKTITNSNVLTYSLKGWKNKHDFDVLVGEETYDLRTTSRSSLFKNYPLGTTPEEAFKQNDQAISFTGYPKLGKTRYTSLSFFGRVNYSFLSKYLFSFDVRADGASKFAPGKQWGYFPAGSVAWRVKNEKFMENVNFISDLKFRAGFGTVGNNRINDYLFLTTFKNDGTYYYGINNQAITAYYPASLVNEDLKWESTLDRNYGMDISLFKNRIDLSVDIYNNSSKDLLLNVPIAPTYGYTSQFQNVGKTSNNGVEIQLNAVILKKTNGLNWNANFNISFNKNRVEKLGVNQLSFLADPSWGVSAQPKDYIIRIGDPVGSVWGWITDGFYKVSDFNYDPATAIYTLKPGVITDAAVIGGPVQPGSIKYKDLNGDGIVDADHDRSIIGNVNPKFTGGLIQQFKYKNWDVSLFVNFSYGNDVYNANKIELTNGYANNANMLAIMADRWKVVTPTGQTAQWVNSTTNQVLGIPPDQLAALNANATIWQPLRSGTPAFFPSSWAIEDGSFLRFNNLTIGYNLPIKNLAGLKMSRLRFYITANNFAIITNYSGYDPEVSVKNNPLTPGLDYSAYPKSRSYIFGVSATF